MYRGCRRHHSEDDAIVKWIVLVLMACFVLPILGLNYLVNGQSDGKKVLGFLMTLVGIILLIAVFAG